MMTAATVTSILQGLAAAAALLAVFAWYRGRRAPFADRLLAVLVPLWFALVATLFVVGVLAATNSVWNGIRLGPTVGLLYGYPLYRLPGQAPMNGHIYGPVGPLLYLPAALFSTPSNVIRAGAALSFLMAWAPIVLLLRAEAGKAGRALATACVGVSALYMFTSMGMSRMAFSVHVDGPAVGLGALACLCVYRPEQRVSRRWMAASAAAAILAVGTKQVMLPIVLAIPLYLGLAEGAAACRRYGRIMFEVGAGVLGIVAFTVDVPAMVYYAVIAPGQHPYHYGFLRVLRDIAPRMAPLLATLAIFGAVAWWARPSGTRWRGWVRSNAWLLPALTGLLCLPVALLSRAKVGGAIQVLNFAIYPVFAAALLVCLRAAALNWRIGRWKGRTVVGAYVAVLTLILMADTLPGVSRLGELVEDLPNESVAAGFAFVRQHPGEVYLPYHPLLTLMAEGRYYHELDPNLTDQFLTRAAGGTLDGPEDDAYFAAHLPPDIEYVLFGKDGDTPLTRTPERPGWEVYIERYLPRFDANVEIGVPGWRALVPAGGATAQE